MLGGLDASGADGADDARDAVGESVGALPAHRCCHSEEWHLGGTQSEIFGGVGGRKVSRGGSLCD